MPRITVKSLAQVAQRPARITGIVKQQKHPEDAPQVFMIPYYITAIAGIRSFFRAGGNPSAIAAALAKAEGISQESRRENNKRTLHQFLESPMSERKLVIAKQKHFQANVLGIDVHLTFDLNCVEQGIPKYILIHPKSVALDPDLAMKTLDICSLVLTLNGTAHAAEQIQYVDLAKGVTHRLRRIVTEPSEDLEKLLGTITEQWEAA